MQRHAHALIVSGVVFVYFFGYLIYSRDVNYSLSSYDACVSDSPAGPAISTKFSALENIHPSSPQLLQAIAALPQLDASGGIPDMHTAIRKYREAGVQVDLFDTLQQLSQRRFEDLFRADDAVRREVRDILFLWAGVDTADPASRGPFIDARELEFVEKMQDKPFLQDGLYPNPAPIDASRIRGEFNEAWNHYYALLLRQIAAQDLYGLAAPKEDAPLTAQGIDRLSRHAADFKAPGDRKGYWTNVVRMVEPAPGVLLSGFLTSPNGIALDKAIRASVPNVTLEDVLNDLRLNPARQGDHLTDRDGRAIGFNVSYQPEKTRVTCYGFIRPDAAAQEEK